jgi:hypothetical protein
LILMSGILYKLTAAVNLPANNRLMVCLTPIPPTRRIGTSWKAEKTA